MKTMILLTFAAIFFNSLAFSDSRLSHNNLDSENIIELEKSADTGCKITNKECGINKAGGCSISSSDCEAGDSPTCYCGFDRALKIAAICECITHGFKPSEFNNFDGQ